MDEQAERDAIPPDPAHQRRLAKVREFIAEGQQAMADNVRTGHGLLRMFGQWGSTGLAVGAETDDAQAKRVYAAVLVALNGQSPEDFRRRLEEATKTAPSFEQLRAAAAALPEEE